MILDFRLRVEEIFFVGCGILVSPERSEFPELQGSFYIQPQPSAEAAQPTTRRASAIKSSPSKVPDDMSSRLVSAQVSLSK